MGGGEPNSYYSKICNQPWEDKTSGKQRGKGKINRANRFEPPKAERESEREQALFSFIGPWGERIKDDTEAWILTHHTHTLEDDSIIRFMKREIRCGV